MSEGVKRNALPLRAPVAVTDFTFITLRLAVGGGIWTRENLEAVKRARVTHIINTQAEFDDCTLLDQAFSNEPEILWLGTEDDFQPKPSEFFRTGVEFALRALEEPGAKLLVHCASGIHRGPLLALVILRVLGYKRRDAIRMLCERRPMVDFPEVYIDSAEVFLAEWEVAQEEEQAES